MSKEIKKKMILRLLLEKKKMSATEMVAHLSTTYGYTKMWLGDMEREGLIKKEQFRSWTFWELTKKGKETAEGLVVK